MTEQVLDMAGSQVWQLDCPPPCAGWLWGGDFSAMRLC